MSSTSSSCISVFLHALLLLLRVLDLSFNLIKHVPEGLEHLTSLDTIYFVQNRISKISGLGRCTTLRSLELGGNKIRVSTNVTGIILFIFPDSPMIQTIEGLENLVDLEELWLGKNKITRLEVCFFFFQKSGPQIALFIS